VSRLPVAPTRSNLFAVRDALGLAQEGYEILDKKREVLTMELMHVAHDAASLQDQVWEMLADAYGDLEVARLSTGRERLEWAALSVTETVEARIRPRSVMGVLIPSVEARGEPTEMPYGLGNTPVALDEAAASFRRVVAAIPALAELMTTVFRLALELQKTQRRVNALQYVFIPQYRETIAYIEGALEEREREEIFRLKRLKSRAAGPSIGPKARQYEQPYRDIGGGRAASHDFG
jgi:V/A-type H+-transporting ATPase subunit D